MKKLVFNVSLTCIMFMGLFVLTPFSSHIGKSYIGLSTLSANCPPHLECESEDGGDGTSCYQDATGNSICFTVQAWCCCGELLFRCDYGGGDCQASWQEWCCDSTCLGDPCCYA